MAPSKAPDLRTLLPFAQAELARRSLLDFARRVYPHFDSPPHIRLIAGLLEEIECGSRRRLAISVPVRHGKSVIASQLFAAWYIGRHPDRNVILASHSEELAVRNSRVAKHFVEDDRWPFRDVQLSLDSTAAGRWNTRQGGGCYAIGCGGAITGRGSDLLLVDDALHDGLSEAERVAVYRWYAEVAIPRLEPGGAVVVIGARFAADDLLGRILDSDDGPNWKDNVVNLAAIAGEEDPLGREPGDALWPNRMGLDELAMRRVAMGSVPFSAQFQQDPLPAGGDVIRADWLEHVYDRLPEELSIIFGVDTAAKTGIGNDYSAICVLGSSQSSHYVIDCIRARVDFPGLRRMLIAAFEKYSPKTMYLEDSSNATGLVQVLKAETTLPIVAVTPRGSKISRVDAQTGVLESGKLLLPNERRISAPWLLDFRRELLGFPNAKHDDQVDALTIALAQVGRPESTFSYATVSCTKGGNRVRTPRLSELVFNNPRRGQEDSFIPLADRRRGLL